MSEPQIEHGAIIPRVPLLKRAAILTLTWHTDMSYRKIAAKLKLKKSTVASIVKRAKVRLKNSM